MIDQAAYGNVNDPGIYAVGTGFTNNVLAWSGSPQAWVVNIYGTGQAILQSSPAAVLRLNNPQRGIFLNTRVYNFAGVGMNRIEEFDCWYGSISVELCGTNAATGHAFQINDGAGTSNMSTTCRLQVEQANCQAIFISPNSLCENIHNIHSERLLNPDNTKPAWIIGGASSSFNGGRFETSGTAANAILWLRGAYSDYTAYRAESVTVHLEGTSGTGITLISPNMTGTVSEYPSQSGALIIVGGVISTWSGNASNKYVFGSGTLSGLLPLTGGTLSGNLKLGTAGNQLFIKEGSNASMGRASLAAGTVVVSNTLASTTMEVFMTHRGVSNAAHVGTLSVSTIVAGTSFVINSTNAADDSDISWLLIERA